MNRSIIFALTIPFIIVFAAILGYNLYNPDRASTSQITSDSPVDVRPVERVEPEENPTTAVRVNPVERPQRSDNQPTELWYKSWSVDEQSDVPRACFYFDSALDPDDRVSLRDYVSVSPETDVALSITHHQLCLTGFDFDRDYEVTLKQGLADKADAKLARAITETVSFGDKPKYVGFAGEGIILPRIKAQGLAVETINVETLNVAITRVSDRMIARRDPQTGQATLEGEYSWEYQDAATNIRETLWSGDFDVKNVRNQKVTTVIPVSKIVGDLKPGAYVITAERQHAPDENRIARAWRWIIVTDLALTGYQGADGLYASVRSIETARLQPGTEVVLVASNNDILATESTDAFGYVNFAAPLLRGKGPKAPKMLMAYGERGDYAMLDLSRAPLDLSEYDVAGRSVSGSLDIYGFSERGVYRPGETVHFTVMVRDMAGNGMTDTPVKFSIRKPNGVEVMTERFDAKTLDAHAGTLTWSYEVPTSAPRGVWTLNVAGDGDSGSQRIEFSVEDFVPQKLKLALKSDESPIRSGEIRDVIVDAQFLYGAPGSALEAEAEARLRIDPNPFPDFKTYKFGPAARDFREELIDMGGGITDGKGQLTLALDAKNNDFTSPFPLRAEITAGVSEPGGRYIRDSLRIPLRTGDVYLGIDPQFEGHYAPRKKPAEFDLIAVDHTGKRISQAVQWTLVDENWDYHWYRENGRWRYRRDVRDVPLENGILQLSDQEPTRWADKLSWGNYRLDIQTEEGAKTGYRFSIGWGRTNRSDSPDRLQMGVSSEQVKAGEMINLSVNAPYAGQAELVIANDKMRMVKPMTLNEGASELSFKFEPEWGSGVYALMTLYTPRDATAQPIPRRAVGISYIGLDRSDQTLNLEIESPDIVRPETQQTFTVRVDKPARNETVWVNFAAVDEGILQITKYQSPDAADYLFGKKALSVDIRDDYGRILNPNLGSASAFKTGGDSLGGEGLTVVPTKTVAMFSGPVRVRNGKADITLDLPEFNGELRLMATAWSKSAVGSASKAVKLRDKVPAIVGLPRFLAPGDKAVATVSLDNVEGRPGIYAATLNAANSITSEGALEMELASGQRQDGQVDIAAFDTGVSTLDLAVTGPGYKRNTRYPLQVRSPFIPITRVERRALEPGQALTLSRDILDGFIPNSSDVTISFSRLPGLDPAPYVKSLARYPYGCTEQTVSSAMPLLYSGNLGGIPGQSETERKNGLRKAVAKLSARQGQDGAFGLWRAGDGYARPWLGVYVTDFLLRAHDEGLYVSEDVRKRAVATLKDISRTPRYLNREYTYWQRSDNRWMTQQKAEAAAYAHYVLARSGQGNLGQMRYFYDNHSQTMRSPMAQAYITSALILMGDERRAQKSLDITLDKLGYEDEDDYYQSGLRDISGAIAALASAEQSDAVLSLVERFQELLEDDDRLHTNEKAHVILALNGLMASNDSPKIRASNTTLTKNENRPSAHLYAADLDQSPTFKSRDDKRMWASISVSGAPVKAPLPVKNGIGLTKTLYRMDGQPLGTSEINQGDRLIVHLRFNSDIRRSRTIVLADLLPAGFEIETILKPEDGAMPDGVKGAYAWAGNIAKFQVVEARDDRFIASLETYRKDEYIAAYVVRAVTPGEFAIPGAVIEDMYRPEDMAITEAGRITIAVDPSL